MSKYRIVKYVYGRADHEYYYYIQYKFLWWWVDYIIRDELIRFNDLDEALFDLRRLKLQCKPTKKVVYEE